MASHKALREKMLRAVARRAGGDLYVVIHGSDIGRELKLPSEQVEPLVRQLIAKGWLERVDSTIGPHSQFRITMAGIEEAEQMETSPALRLIQRYPVVAGTVFAVVQAVLIAAALALFGLNR